MNIAERLGGIFPSPIEINPFLRQAVDTNRMVEARNVSFQVQATPPEPFFKR